jgi:serine/threonine-protein kinase
MKESFRTAPTVSVNHGSAGLAYSLQRIACSTDDGELLAVADAWCERAVREIETAAAFFSEEINVTAASIGHASLYHQPPGVFLVQALIAAARGDQMTLSRACGSFVAHGVNALKEPNPNLDLTLGLAGSLLGSAFLVDAIGRCDGAAANASRLVALKSLARRLYSQLWARLDGYAPIGEASELEDTGIAHGWAGLLYASLCWCSAAQEMVPSSLRDRLDQLAKRGEPVGRGLRWLWGRRSYMPGWCNGSAGFVFLWTEAYKAIGESRYLSLAERAAWSTWESPARLASLCCGLTGQSYALLNVYGHSRDEAWLRRAEKLAEWAAAASLRSSPEASSRVLHRESLYYGVPGIAVLVADLAHPLEARMPLFERE